MSLTALKKFEDLNLLWTAILNSLSVILAFSMIVPCFFFSKSYQFILININCSRLLTIRLLTILFLPIRKIYRSPFDIQSYLAPLSWLECQPSWDLWKGVEIISNLIILKSNLFVSSPVSRESMCKQRRPKNVKMSVDDLKDVILEITN